MNVGIRFDLHRVEGSSEAHWSNVAFIGDTLLGRLKKIDRSFVEATSC